MPMNNPLFMKNNLLLKTISLISLMLTLNALHSSGQLTTGGIHSSFGVDADTRAAFVKYGASTGSITTDDWFGPMTGTSRGVIDTSNAASYLAQIQANKSISFSKRMAVQMYTKVNSSLWLDGVYARDYTNQRNAFGTYTGKDSSSFGGGSKNNTSPATWVTYAASMTDKADLVDVFAHMRRDGLNVTDSLWFFTGLSTLGTAGARYCDVELYKKDLTYSRSTLKFTTAGTDQGHSAWKFDASGNITETGDLIIAMDMPAGSTPVIDVRIWVSYATYTSITPSLFRFGTSYDGNTTPTGYGYATILSKTGTTTFGAGIANYTASGLTDTTNAGPWGSTGLVAPVSTSATLFSNNFQSLQFVEVGINLTRMGVDPALYTAIGASACDQIYSSVLFKSRASASFTAALLDFMEPIQFLDLPEVSYNFKTDTISCTKSVATLNVTNNSTAGYFSWSTSGGNIASSNVDSTSVNVSAPGKYVLKVSQKQGCAIKSIDTLVVASDTSKPVATAAVTANSSGVAQLVGGDVTASNYATPFGGSKGLTFNWTGPNGFTSTAQSPLTYNDWGTYDLTVTERRNGCSVSSSVYVNFAMLDVHNIDLRGSFTSNAVALSWKNNAGEEIAFYEMEKSVSGSKFQPIGKVNGVSLSVRELSFNDRQPASVASYRIKAVTNAGNTYYSPVVSIKTTMAERNAYLVNTQNSSNTYLIANANQPANGRIAIIDISGNVLKMQQVTIVKGVNTIQVPRTDYKTNQVVFIKFYVGNDVMLTQQVFN
jgi:hypothetical protein